MSMFLIFVILIGYLVISLIFKEDRTKTLVEIEKDDKLKFVIDEKEYYIGDVTKKYLDDGLNYNSNSQIQSGILSDSIALQGFSDNDNNPLFLSALYCSEEETCNYDESVVVKINFYKNSDVVVDDFLKFGLTYEEVRKKYGKEDGEFSQNEEYLIWTFDDEGEIGEPYYMLRFDDSYSSKEKSKLVDIRIGVWWYPEEFEYTVK